jgi:hypothetical protein
MRSIMRDCIAFLGIRELGQKQTENPNKPSPIEVIARE